MEYNLDKINPPTVTLQLQYWLLIFYDEKVFAVLIQQ
jgi:hypothetical protein